MMKYIGYDSTYTGSKVYIPEPVRIVGLNRNHLGGLGYQHADCLNMDDEVYLYWSDFNYAYYTSGNYVYVANDYGGTDQFGTLPSPIARKMIEEFKKGYRFGATIGGIETKSVRGEERTIELYVNLEIYWQERY